MKNWKRIAVILVAVMALTCLFSACSYEAFEYKLSDDKSYYTLVRMKTSVVSEVELPEKYSGKYMTFRFSPGYGDYPIEMQKEYLRILDAPRKIGLTTGDSCLLVPSKSVTAVLGISDNPIERRKRGCAICSMKGKCRFRRNGEHCGV